MLIPLIEAGVNVAAAGDRQSALRETLANHAVEDVEFHERRPELQWISFTAALARLRRRCKDSAMHERRSP